MPEGARAINDRVWYRDDGEVRAIFCGTIPFHSYCRSDRVHHKFAAAQLIESGLASQKGVSAAFGLSVPTLRRARRRVAAEGIGGLVSRPKGPKGRRKAKAGVARRIVALREEGHEYEGIALRLGVSSSTVNRILREQGLTRREPEPTGLLALEPSAGGPGPLGGEVEASGAGLVEATSVAYASLVDQVLTQVGMIEEAPVEFAPAREVPRAGVLLGLALLGTTGLVPEARGVYGKLRNGWYGLRATLWTLFVMALIRIKRAEQLKGVDPAGLGQVLGLPRAPEVKTIRRKLKELSLRGLAATLHRRLARRRAERSEGALAYLYVDGHVRAYSGKRKIGKAYVTARRSVLRAETDYWVNTGDGQPLLVVHAEANERLTQGMREILKEVREVVGDQRAMIVFDRGGWSRELFRMVVAEGFDLLTYRKAPLSDWGPERFSKESRRIDGHRVTYEVADGEFQRKGWPRLRCIAVKREDGRQTQILCNRYDLDAAVLAYRMFGRWKQENWFKYMGEEYALDVLVDYGTEPDDPNRLVVNPAWRTLVKNIATAREEVEAAEAVYGRATMSGVSVRAREERRATVERTRETYETLVRERRDMPRQVRLGDVSDREPIKLAYERKLLTDTIKMCAYEVETKLTEMLEGVFRRQAFEGRAVIREIFQTAGDLSLSDGQLHVRLSQLSAPRYTQALMTLCEKLNGMDPTIPETSLRLRFHVKPRPESGQN